MTAGREGKRMGMRVAGLILAVLAVVLAGGCGPRYAGGESGVLTPGVGATMPVREVLPDVPLARVKGTGVNIRAGRTTAYEVLAQVGWGTELPVLKTEHGWHQVLLPVGTRAWIAADYVKLGEEERERLAAGGIRGGETFRGTVTGDDVRVRARAGLVSSVLYKAFAGDEVLVTGMRTAKGDDESPGAWYEIIISGDASGWISGDFVELTNTGAAAE